MVNIKINEKLHKKKPEIEDKTCNKLKLPIPTRLNRLPRGSSVWTIIELFYAAISI